MSKGPVKTFDADEVDIVLGPLLADGYADGDFCVAARNNPSFVMVVGANGEAARAKSNDESGTIVLTLLQVSNANDVLSAFSLADENTAAGVFPVMIKDRSGRTLIMAETAWIEKPADVTFGKEITNREWTIVTNCLQMLVGGN